MAASPMNEAMQHLRRSVLLRDGAALTDGQLLGRFIERRDEAAFAALVRRHGAMVWGICRRLLNDHDAEDAFQATFLVLVRKAASVVPRERVANWLYGVARQAALQARRAAARRGARERQVTEMPEPAVAEQDLWRDLRPLLDQELGRLPDAYREVVVLSDLEGKTRKEVARQLGLPEGTVGSRLARARAMLARRLTQRGVALSAGALAAVLSQEAAPAGAPNSVVDSTIQAASRLAAGQTAGMISAEVAALAEGVVKAMLLNKLKVVSAVLLVVAALSGAMGLVYQTQAAERPKALRATQKADEKLPAAQKDEKPPSDRGRRRLLRWQIVFNTKDGKEYAKQLEALGATLAIPTKHQNQYRLICDLSKRPVKATVEDISKRDHIFLVETNNDSIRSLSKELGLKETPEQIVVFLPRFIEDELLRKELDYAHRPEEDIVETTFRFSRTNRGFDIEVTSQR
jgi:RNA polymerase sigma factor (sigma-70 family)